MCVCVCLCGLGDLNWREAVAFLKLFVRSVRPLFVSRIP
jgi:hypothetical protein